MNSLMDYDVDLATHKVGAVSNICELNELDAADLIRSILLSHRTLQDVAKSSYVHQLGFEKYVLYQAPNGESIRLHYWPQGSAGNIEDIHSHCAAFSSRILKGKLTSQTFSICDGSSHSVYRYRFNELLERSEVQHYGTTGISEGQSVTHATEDGYSVQMSELHRVTNVASGTITMSRWDRRSADAIVVKTNESEAVDCNREAGMPLDYVKQQLVKILMEIS